MLSIADHIATTDRILEGGDVYKATRSDHQVSAVEVFAFKTTAEEDHFFTQQANLLSEAVRHYYASVPTILGWGFTKAGNFPFIETEWIEGYDLDQLADNDKNITLDDLGAIAEQISRVLTICHNAGIVHGKISKKQIRWDKNKQRYTLAGFRFGLKPPEGGSFAPAAVPIQRDEALLKQKDIRDLGIVLLALLEKHFLPGTLKGKTVLDPSVDHTQLKDGSIMPAWLATCIRRAVNTNEETFKSAHEMYSYIILHHKTPFVTNRWFRSKPQRPNTVSSKHSPKTTRPSGRKLRSSPVQGARNGRGNMRFVFDRRIAIGLLIAALLVGFSIIAQKGQDGKANLTQTDRDGNTQLQDTTNNTLSEINNHNVSPGTVQAKQTSKKNRAGQKLASGQILTSAGESNQQEVKETDLGAYKVKSRAYFHNAPDERTRRRGFIVHWNNAILHPSKEKNDFVYVVYTNDEGLTSKGWLRKKDLVKQ